MSASAAHERATEILRGLDSRRLHESPRLQGLAALDEPLHVPGGMCRLLRHKIVDAVVGDVDLPDFPLGVEREVFILREDDERF
jgi:hypothetical protein